MLAMPSPGARSSIAFSTRTSSNCGDGMRSRYRPDGRRSGTSTTAPPRRRANSCSASTSDARNSSGAPMTTASNALSASAVSAPGGVPARTSSPFDACTSDDTSKLGSCSSARRMNVAFHDGLGSCTSTLRRRPLATKRRSAALSASVVSPSVGSDAQRHRRRAARRRRISQRRVEPLGVARPPVLDMRELGAVLLEDDPGRLPRQPIGLDDAVEHGRPANAPGVWLVGGNDANVWRCRPGDGDGRDGHAVTGECGRWSGRHQPRPRRPARPRSRTSPLYQGCAPGDAARSSPSVVTGAMSSTATGARRRAVHDGSMNPTTAVAIAALLSTAVIVMAGAPRPRRFAMHDCARAGAWPATLARRRRRHGRPLD